MLLFVSGLFATGGQIGLNALAGTFYPTFIRATGVGWAFGIGRRCVRAAKAIPSRRPQRFDRGCGINRKGKHHTLEIDLVGDEP